MRLLKRNLTDLLLLYLILDIAVRVAALPQAHPPSRSRRQTWTGAYAHDFSLLGCKPIILVYARETLASGNMGTGVGPLLSNILKTYFGPEAVATEGVDYLALMETNYLEGGAPLVGTYEMQVLLTSAATLCSRNQTKAIVVAGYSQGAAIVHKAIAGLSEAVRERITAVVTFGDTRGLQDAYAIPGFRRNKTLIVCNPGDALCAGMLLVLWPAHWDYIRHVPAAATWLAQKILEVAPNITQVIPVPSVITPVVAQPAPDDASTPTPAASPTAASTSVASAATASAAATAAPSDTALSQVLWWWLPSAWQGQQQKQQTGTASTGSVATKAARRRRWPYFNWAA